MSQSDSPALTCSWLQAYQKLAEQLPFAKHVHSKLLCHVTKELMDEDNVPMVMPNGNVYSQKAVRRLSSSGMFTCPKSGAPLPYFRVQCPGSASLVSPG